GRPRLAVDNLGNTRLTASVGGNDNGDHLSYDVHPGNVQVEPGRAAFVAATLKPRRIIWFGPKERRPYTLTVQRSGVAPLAVEGTYIQRGFLPRWLATFLGMLLALAITFVMIWISYKPQVKSLATEKVQDAAVSTLAPPRPPASAPPPPSPSAAVTPTQAAGAGAGAGDGGSSGGGEAQAPPSAKPVQETAAAAVRRLAADDPAGRHICYRAYVNGGTGWQKPVCDGTIAGTVKQGKQILALNVSVAGGGKGLVATPVFPDPGSSKGEGKFSDWTPTVADDEDLYLGSAKQDAPTMLGFIMAITNGQICQTVETHDEGWKPQGCAQANPNFVYGGSLKNDVPLEAVKFTV
ncbi:hydrolase, partial [Streptomyces sp. NPDC048664]|uniref:hydrolase n=1 Tax=Streptomyces sp. NPDC048664 TaxID=3154505 RepID=UPI003431D9D5